MNNNIFKLIKKKNHIININNKKYLIPVEYYYEFLKLDNYNNESYKNYPIEDFTYGLVNYFSKHRNLLNEEMLNRLKEIKKYQLIDYESINKCLKTNDRKLSKVKLNSFIKQILFTRYDSDDLKNIIKVYIELCKLFIYNDLYYLNDSREEIKNIYKIASLENINEKNNKVVCFQFTEIFGYFLNSLGIKYEVVGKQTFYGYDHTYIIFCYEKYIIKINPIYSIFKNDYVNTKTNLPLIGIESLNQNTNTKQIFNKILSDCYKKEEINYDHDYLPCNKIENDLKLNGNLHDYLIKIDLVFKKINDLNLSVIDKLAYFNILMHYFFNNELDKNIIYSFVHNYFNIYYIIALNEININNDNSLYIVYDGNNLCFSSKEEVESLFLEDNFKYLNKKRLPKVRIYND